MTCRPGSVVSNVPVTLTGAGGDWTSVLFPLLPSSLDGGAVGNVLAHVSRLRLISTSATNSLPVNVVSTLGVDNITAVPEPGSAWMLLTGLTAFATGCRLRARKTKQVSTAAT